MILIKIIDRIPSGAICVCVCVCVLVNISWMIWEDFKQEVELELWVGIGQRREKKEWVFLGEGCLILICFKVGTNRRHG